MAVKQNVGESVNAITDSVLLGYYDIYVIWPVYCVNNRIICKLFHA